MSDMTTAKLAALQFYQLAIPAPMLPDGSFNREAAARGEALFKGQANCAQCHVPPLFTEPGWNTRKASEIGIDDFQSSHSPDNELLHRAPTRALHAHEGRFLPRREFATLLDVVNHYNDFKRLDLSEQEKRELVEFLTFVINNA